MAKLIATSLISCLILCLGSVNGQNGYKFGVAPVDQTPQMRTLIRAFNYSVYPNNVNFANSHIIPTDAWAADVVGRFNPVGNLTGLNDVVDYFIGVANNFSTSQVMTHNIRSHIEVGNVIAETHDTTLFDSRTQISTLVTTIGFFKFNTAGLIAEFDMSTLNSGAFEKALGLDSTDPNVQGFINSQTCGNYAKYCQKQNEFGNSHNPDKILPLCNAFMNSIPFGTPDQAAGPTGYCRFLHSLMTPYRPEVHCYHVGPEGGSDEAGYKCVEIFYNSYYNYLTNYPSPFIGDANSGQ